MSETARVIEEEHGKSLSTLRLLGVVAARGALEASPEYQLGYDDFHTSVEEMLKTDPEFRQSLDIASKRTFNSYGGHVVAADGTPMVTVIERGMQNSFRAAQADPQMWAQYIRDKGDRDNAIKVDQLSPGQSLVGLSMDPKNELRQNPKFWQDRGYREGIAYVQWYSKQLDGSVVAGSLSVDLSDETTWRTLLQQRGVDVPAGVTPNEWLAQSLALRSSPEQTEQFVKQLRSDYYQLRGANRHRFSVTEYAQAHEALLRQQFDMYYPALGQAIVGGQSNSAVQGFAASVLARAHNLDPAKRRQLMTIVNTTKFSEADGRLLDGALRYAVVEDLRRGLDSFVKGGSARPAEQWAINPGLPPEVQYYMMNERLASGVQSGASAGRSYGGCAGQFNAAAEASRQASDSDKPDQQGAYGGRDGQGASAESSGGACEYMHYGCYCCPYNDDGTPLIKPKKVKARRDEKGVAKCQRIGCNAMLAPGLEPQKGDIYKRAQELGHAPADPDDEADT